MKKNFTHLVTAIVAVAFVAALTGTAIFAFDNGQAQKILTFLPHTSAESKTPVSSEEMAGIDIKGVITELTPESITIDGT
jgi:hypothetical protein